jgi:hypothetical protein
MAIKPMLRRIRKIAFSREPSVPVGIVWCEESGPLPDGLGADDVAVDHAIVDRGGGAWIATSTARARTSSSDAGLVYAWDGRQIGWVEVDRRGGRHLRFVWPPGLVHRSPELDAWELAYERDRQARQDRAAAAIDESRAANGIRVDRWP